MKSPPPSPSSLPEKLRHEAEGILLWAVKGARKVLDDGCLRVPATARRDGLAGMDADPMDAFFRDCCCMDDSRDLWCNATELTKAFNVYQRRREGRKWADWTAKRMHGEMRARGFDHRRNHHGAAWIGLALKS